MPSIFDDKIKLRFSPKKQIPHLIMKLNLTFYNHSSTVTLWVTQKLNCGLYEEEVWHQNHPFKSPVSTHTYINEDKKNNFQTYMPIKWIVFALKKRRVYFWVWRAPDQARIESPWILE